LGQESVDADPSGDRDIEGIEWVLVGTVRDGDLGPGPADAEVRVRLEGGVLTLIDRCDEATGAYVLDPVASRLSFVVAEGTTLCASNEALPGVLAGVDGYVLTGSAFTLLDDAAVPVLTFEGVVPSDVTPSGRWLATGYDLFGNGLVAPRPGSNLSVVFGPDGVLDGTTGCGGFIGAYSVDGGAITIGIRTTGVSPCGQRKRDEEIDYTSALQTVVMWAPTATGLDLVDADGLTRIRLVSGDRGTIVGDWTVLRFVTPNGRLIEPLPDVDMWMRFGSDDQVEGSSGCRSFDGEYLLDGDRLAIGPISPTGLPCRGDFRRQERRFLRAIDAAIVWIRDGSRLELLDGSGETLIELIEGTQD
jgi:heat shock protein HslJ